MSTPTQPGWAPPQPPTTPPRKRHVGRNIALAVVGLFILGGVISAINGGGTTAPSAITSAPAATEGPTSPSATTVAEAPAATAAPATTTKPAPKHWTNVISVSGSSDKRTPAFTLHDGRARLRYTFTDSAGYGMVVGAVYVLAEGTSLAADGGIPEVMVSAPGSDSTELAQGPGRYYLDISAANARWTVTIQELR